MDELAGVVVDVHAGVGVAGGVVELERSIAGVVVTAAVVVKKIGIAVENECLEDREGLLHQRLFH